MPRFGPVSARKSGLFGLALFVLALAGAAEPEPKEKAPANRLAKETSPYLLLHAHNPVDWFPWGPEAFTRARAEGKPIFLSVGYSACYWCHVMERQSFMNPAIARFLNEHFVSIKVDREERPDVDQIYMTAVRAFGNGGGWPMSMFLTPDGRPFFGGTYFPPEDHDGFEGFLTLLKRVDQAWRDHRAELEKDADQLVTVVRRALDGASAQARVPLSHAVAARARAQLAEQFDPAYGGFGYDPGNPRRPKFPEPVNLVFLLEEHRRGAGAKPAPEATPTPLTMVVTTLDQMARGGIRDQLAGGYHRYSTNRYWTVPHFEKMLYDNAQLASVQLSAFELTGDVRWRSEVEATFAFLANKMTGPEGGFFSALDAESQAEEGQSYVWTRDEVGRVLGVGADFDLFAQVYGLKQRPNFSEDRYVLLEPHPRAEQAAALKITPAALESRLAPLRARLLAVRERRPAPLCDDKVLTAWNGLTIAALADGFRLLKDPRYRQAADRAADFVLARLRTADGRLLRTYRNGQAKLPAYLEDYAFLVHGLLRLHAATGDPDRLAQARALTDRMIADFADTRQGGLFATAGDHESLLARPKDPYDGALPSGNSVAIRNLVALSAATGQRRYLDVAGQALEAFSSLLAQSPAAMPLMVVALEEYLDARPSLAAVTAVTPKPVPDETQPGGQTVLTAQAATALKSAIAPGKSLDATLTLVIKEGWHLYANPTGVDSLKPTTLTMPSGQPATLAEVDYPVATSVLVVPESPEKAAVYEGKVTLPIRIQLDAQAPAGPLTLTLKVGYQACNDRACLAPATLTVPLTVTVAPTR
jgi:uncharacterized protein YyaL (SSP411 family)